MSTFTEPAAHPLAGWRSSRACLEDRAMGLELELIEAVRRRDLAERRGEDRTELERRIASLSEELADLVA
jgi:hypothetical protein